MNEITTVDGLAVNVCTGRKRTLRSPGTGPGWTRIGPWCVLLEGSQGEWFELDLVDVSRARTPTERLALVGFVIGKTVCM